MSTSPYPLYGYNPNDPTQNPALYGTAGIYGSPSVSALPQLPNSTQSQIQNITGGNATLINATGQQIEGEAQSQLPFYSALETGSAAQEQQALQQLQQTPGYTPEEASQINLDYGQYNTPTSSLQQQFLTPDEQQQIAGNPQAAQDVATQGISNEGAMLNQYQGNLGGTLSDYQQNLSGQVGNYGNYTSAGLNTLNSGLSGASSPGAFGALNTAVDNPALGYEGQEKQMTDAQVQQMQQAAATTVGNQYESAEDQLQRQAAAAGNTSPLAVAAANARLQTQSAAGAADAETAAAIQAQQAQATRANQIEQQRQGETATQAGMEAGAATTEQSQQQSAAALSGTEAVQAGEATGQAGINAANAYGGAALGAANTYGAESVNESNTMTGQNYQAGLTADELASQRAAMLGTNRQTTQTGVNQTQYAQGVGSAQDTSAGAQAVGNARMGGMGQYRAGVAGQEQLGQTGGQAAVGEQLGAYGTQTGGINNAASTRVALHNGSPTAASTFQQVASGASALVGSGASAANTLGLNEGGIITRPTLAIIAERKPERVISMGSYRKAA